MPLEGKCAARRMKVSRENYVRGARMRKIWGEEALDFQEKLLNSSGLGDETYFPDSEHFLPGPTPTNGQAIAVWHPFLNYQASWGCQLGPCNNTRRQQGSGVWCKGLRLMLRRCSPGV